MGVLNIVLSVVDIILAVAIIILFLVQEGNDRGIGVVAGGSSDSYYRQRAEHLKSSSKHGQLSAASFSQPFQLFFIFHSPRLGNLKLKLVFEGLS